MARIYIFMVASKQMWNLINFHSRQTNVIQKGENFLYLLPWMDLTTTNSTVTERKEWIIGEILNVINNNKLTGNDITILIHANDYWSNGPGILDRKDQLPIEIREEVNRCVLYRRDTTQVYAYLTKVINIQSDTYLTNIEEQI